MSADRPTDRPRSEGDVPLPILSDEDAAAPAAVAEDAWTLPQPFATSLVGLWPGADAPEPDEVVEAFARFLREDIRILETIEPEDGAIEWNRVLAVPGLPAPVIVWAERARAMGPDDLPDAALASYRWVVGCESMLSTEAPLEDFIALVRLLAGSIEGTPAVLDAMTRQWFTRPELESLFLADEPEATEEVLWRIQAVGRAERLQDDDRIWLYTVGLWRCGKPELEILELPGRHVGAGVALLNGIAALALAAPIPQPGTVAAIGQNLRVAFRPWREAAAYLDAASVGSVADRRAAEEAGELNPLMGVRAAICDPEPRGTFRPLWTWPAQAVALIEEGRGALYLSERSTREIARRANRTWPEFATAFASVGRHRRLREEARSAEGELAFLVKAAFSDAGDPERGREHLWFEIKSLRGDSVEAELLNAPQLATHLKPGDTVAIDRSSVTDWRVILPEGGFGPANAEELLRAIDRAIAGAVDRLGDDR